MNNIFLILWVLFVFAFGVAQSQTKETQKNIIIQSVIKTEMGKPISGAKIYGNEGAEVVTSDVNGHFMITVHAGSKLLIESKGYEAKELNQVVDTNAITLKSVPFLMGKDDEVKIAFGTQKKANLLGDITVIEPGKFSAYDNTQSLLDAINGRVPGMFGSDHIRGFGNAMVVVDGIPRYANISDVNLSMQEIDKITVLKDAGAIALYGTEARDGVIMITTKRGQANKRTANISVIQGISTPVKLPSYLNSVDYMTLYNEALVNDGLPVKYDAATIKNFMYGNKYHYPSIDYFSSDYLNPYKKNTKIMAEFSGGNDNATFYTNVGWSRDGSLLNFGQGVNAASNRFNIRGNVDFKVNSFIRSSVDIAGILDFSNGPVGNDYFADASTMAPNILSPLLPMNLMQRNDAINQIIDSRKNDVGGLYMLGGTQLNTTNLVANTFAGGSNQLIERTMQFKYLVDFDLGIITKGLSAKANFSLDFYNSYNQTIPNLYSVYQPTWGDNGDTIVALTQYGSDSKTGTQTISTANFTRSIGITAQIDYHRTFAGMHTVNATLLGYDNTWTFNGVIQPQKNVHVGLRLAYDFRNKYFIDLSGAYVNSIQLPAATRGAISPTLAVGWTISEENFLKDNTFINYLKLKASVGEINTDKNLVSGSSSLYYGYDNVYASSGTYRWGDGLYSNPLSYSVNGTNNALTFEKRKEINLGLEGSFFNHSINLDVNVFKTHFADQYSRPSILFPSYYTDFIPWTNYGEIEYKGAELGLNYTKKIGDFGFDIGATAMLWDSKVISVDELNLQSYLNRAGKHTDAILSLQSEGLFKDDADIAGHAFQTFGVVKPGDIKYKDQNNDGVIDNNDLINIGRSTPPFTYGLEIKLSYQNFSFFATGTGIAGSQSFMQGNYYWIDGAKKYSEVVDNRWTVATQATATYPRLSSQTNSNNNRLSSFWMYNSDYFSINRMQITYDLKESFCRKIFMKKTSVYLSGSNLARISKHNDILDLRVGGEPYYRNYMIGIKVAF